MKKYVKPLARELNDVSLASGAPLCTSGTFPGQKCDQGNKNVGPCDTFGNIAGRDCTSGTTPGTPYSCTPGETVTDCSNGFFASVRMPGGG